MIGYHWLWGTTLTSLMLPFFGCWKQDPPPDIALSTAPMAAKPPPATDRQLAKLREIAPIGSDRGKLVDDVAFFLQGQIHQQKGEHRQAADQFLAAAKSESRKLAAEAFRQWVTSLVEELNRRSPRASLARLILSESKQGTELPWMVKNGLTDQSSLFEWFHQNLNADDFPRHDPDRSQTPKTPPPIDSQLPDTYEAILEINKKACKLDLADEQAWQTWGENLPIAEQAFWGALMAECDQDWEDAIATYKGLFAKTSGAKNLRLWSIRRVIHIYRGNDQRPVAAEEYLKLVKFWQTGGLTPNDLGITRFKFALEQINDTLWAARYRALIGDLIATKGFAQKALNLISEVPLKIPGMDRSQKQQLADLRAEAYHTIAFRVAVEQSQFESAVALNALGMQSPYLTPAWRDRLNWYRGLYEYSAGNFQSAKKIWEKMVDEADLIIYRDRLYFWLARIHSKQRQNEEARFYHRALAKEFPLSFYNVVTRPQKSDDWRSQFRNAPIDKLPMVDNQKVQTFRHDPRWHDQVLRAEILAAAGVQKWAVQSIRSLQIKLANRYRIDQKPSWYIYLTRLYFGAEDYLRAISLTTQLIQGTDQFWQKWPEQIYIYYPRPYADMFSQQSLKHSVRQEILQGIARKETAFRADAISYAGAKGLMQFITPTAMRLAPGIGLDADQIEDRLGEPAVSIALGGLYVKHLMRSFPRNSAAVFAAYNAGEYAVETWLKRRPRKDLLQWIEMVPFQQTQNYIKGVWRNQTVYRHLNAEKSKLALNILRKSIAKGPSSDAKR